VGNFGSKNTPAPSQLEPTFSVSAIPKSFNRRMHRRLTNQISRILIRLWTWRNLEGDRTPLVKRISKTAGGGTRSRSGHRRGRQENGPGSDRSGLAWSSVRSIQARRIERNCRLPSSGHTRSSDCSCRAKPIRHRIQPDAPPGASPILDRTRDCAHPVPGLRRADSESKQNDAGF